MTTLHPLSILRGLGGYQPHAVGWPQLERRRDVFLPIGDTPNPRGYIASVTWGLIAVNIGIFVFLTLPLSGQPVDPRDPLLLEYLQLVAPEIRSPAELAYVLRHISAYDLFVFEHGYKPGAAEVSDLLASMFLHGGLAHLFGNMLFLWIFGNNVEHRMGRLAYLAAYLGTGVVATLTFALMAGSSKVPLVGASGAISGVLGIYFLAFPRNKVKVFVFLFPILFNVVLIPCRWVLGFYVLVDNLLPIFLGVESGVAYGAHIGGFLGGLAVAGAGHALAWRLPWGKAAWRVQRDAQWDPSQNPSEALKAALDAGNRDLAVQALQHLEPSGLGRLSPEQGTRLAEWLLAMGQLGPAERALRQTHTGRRALTPAEVARATLVLGLLRVAQGQIASGYQYLRRVVEIDADDQATERALAALAEIPLSRKWRS